MLEILVKVNFVSSRKNIFYSRKFRESWILWIIIVVCITTYEGLPPPAALGSRRRMVTHIYLSLHRLQPSFWRRGFATAKYHGLEAHPCTCRWYCLTLLSEVSSQTPRPQVFAFPLMRPLLMAGSAGRGIFAKVLRKFCEGAGETKVHFEGEWPSKPCKNCLISNNLSREGDSVMLAACLQGYEKVIRDDFVWCGRWWLNLDKRSCCSTWPRER